MEAVPCWWSRSDCLFARAGRRRPWWSSSFLKFSSYLWKVWLLRTRMSHLWVIVPLHQLYRRDTPIILFYHIIVFTTSSVVFEGDVSLWCMIIRCVSVFLQSLQGFNMFCICILNLFNHFVFQYSRGGLNNVSKGLHLFLPLFPQVHCSSVAVPLITWKESSTKRLPVWIGTTQRYVSRGWHSVYLCINV